jgi:hypothetical protein
MVSAALGGRLGNIPNPIKNEHKNLIKGTSLNRVMGLWAGISSGDQPGKYLYSI